MANRFDVFTAKVPKKDSNGFLTVNATPTRAGVFIYRDSVGNEWGELRHPDDVFSQETLDSLNGIPYTIQENHVSLFTPKDAKGKTYGFTLSDARQESDHSAVSIKIIDGEEIEAVERKDSLELSNGYSCDVINESGTFGGIKFQKRQKNICYNHVARVSNARGGETCRIRLDSKGAICGVEADRIDSEEISATQNGESIMTIVKRKIPAVKVKDFRLDAEPVEIPAEHEGVVDRLESRQETLVSALEAREEKIDSLEKVATANQAKVDVLESENKDLKEANKNSIPSEKLDSHVRERAKYLSYAKDYKLDGAESMANDDILRGIVVASKKVKDETKLDDMTYTTAVFDMLDHEYEKKKLDSAKNLEDTDYKLDGDGKVSKFDQAKRRGKA